MRMKGFIFRTVTIVSLVIFILLLTEIGLRIFWNGKPKVPELIPSPGYHEDKDPSVGYTLIPNHKYKRGNITTDMFGFRVEPALEEAKKPGVFRIVVLGDSIVFGVKTPSDKTISSVLQKRLEEITCPGISKFEVINLGMPGHNIGQYAAVLKKYGMRYSPDLVITGITISNDLEGRQARYLGKGHLYLEPTASFEGVNISHKLPPKFIRSLYMWRYLYFHYSGLKRMERIREMKIAAENVPPKMLLAPMNETDEVWKDVSAGLKSIYRTADAVGAKTMFILFPAVEQIYYEDIPETPQRIIEKILKPYKADVLDFYDPMKSNYLITGMLPFNDFSSHPSRSSYDIIASSIRDRLAAELGAVSKVQYKDPVRLGFDDDMKYLSYGWGQRRKIGGVRFRNIQGAGARIVFSSGLKEISGMKILLSAVNPCLPQKVELVLDDHIVGSVEVSAAAFSRVDISFPVPVKPEKFNLLELRVIPPCRMESKGLLAKNSLLDTVSVSEIRFE